MTEPTGPSAEDELTATLMGIQSFAAFLAGEMVAAGITTPARVDGFVAGLAGAMAEQDLAGARRAVDALAGLLDAEWSRRAREARGPGWTPPR